MINYDGPSFYKKNQDQLKSSSQKKKRQSKGTPLADLKKDENRLSELSKKSIKKQKEQDTKSKNYYFRSKYIPKSLQNLDGWNNEKWDNDLLYELERRLKKAPEDYLLFSVSQSEEPVSTTIKENKTSYEKPLTAEALRIQQKVAEIENTLDTAALVQKEIKTEVTKPNTGLHRTLSKIIAEDAAGLKNRKNHLDSLFSNKR